jgi:hypothetical protein
LTEIWSNASLRPLPYTNGRKQKETNHRMGNTAKVFLRIVGEVGQNNANVSFRPDGRYGCVAVNGEDTLAVVETRGRSRWRSGRTPARSRWAS